MFKAIQIMLVVLVSFCYAFPAQAQETVIPLCKREITRYYWYAPTAERPDEGYLAVVKWDLPTDGDPVGSCTAVYQLSSPILKTVAKRDVDCAFSSPGTAFCSSVITGYAEARFYGYQSANFVTDSETTWFLGTYRILLPVGVRSE